MDATDPEQLSTLGKIGAGLASVAAAVAGTFLAMWKSHGRRIGVLEDDVKKKADNAEMVRVRDHVASLYQGQETIRKDMNAGFNGVTDQLHRLELLVTKHIARER